MDNVGVIERWTECVQKLKVDDGRSEVHIGDQCGKPKLKEEVEDATYEHK